MLYAGLDLGQAHDYSALLIIEQDVQRYSVRHIERFALGTPYPTIVEKVSERMLALTPPRFRAPPPPKTPLVIDGTGCGRPVVDLFWAKPELDVHPVLITGGDKPSFEDGYMRVPKRDLVGVIQVLLQSGRLKIAADLREARALTAELVSFEAKITTTAHDVYGAWREGQHDDLVLGLALPLYYAEHALDVWDPGTLSAFSSGRRL